MRTAIRLVVTALLAAILMWAAYCVWFYLGDNGREALRPLTVPAMAWHFTEGGGSVDDGRLVLTDTGRLGEVFVFAPLDAGLSGEVLDRIVVRFSAIDYFHTFAIGVSQSGQVSGVRPVAAHWADEATAVVEARSLRLNGAPISHLGLSIRSGLDEPAEIEAAELHRKMPGFAELQVLLLESLVDLSPWTQRSINYNRAKYVPLEVSPVISVMLWVLLTGSGLLAWRLMRRRSIGSHAFTMFVVLLLVGTLMLDAGWQVSLWNRHAQAVRDHGGPGASDGPAGNEETGIQGFMERLKSELGDDSRRMVIFAGSDYGFIRARYFAIPHPAVGRKGVHPRWLYRMRSGDVLVGIGTYPRLQVGAVSESADGEAAIEARDWPVSVVPGLDEVWAARSRWLAVDTTGMAELDLVLAGLGGADWVTILIEQSLDGEVRQWARRDVFLDGERRVRVTLPFELQSGAHYRLKLHADSNVQADVAYSRLEPFRADQPLETVSVGEGSPFVLARPVAEASSHRAWEIQ